MVHWWAPQHHLAPALQWKTLGQTLRGLKAEGLPSHTTVHAVGHTAPCSASQSLPGAHNPHATSFPRSSLVTMCVHIWLEVYAVVQTCKQKSCSATSVSDAAWQ